MSLREKCRILYQLRVQHVADQPLFTFEFRDRARVAPLPGLYQPPHGSVSWQGHSRRCDNLENDGLPLHITRTERYT